MPEKPQGPSFTAEQEEEILRLSASKLINSYSQTPFWKWFGNSIAIHLVLIALLSIGFIRGLFGSKPEEPVKAKVEESQPATPAAAQPAAGQATDTAAATGGIPDGVRDTAVVRETTSLPEEGEIPAMPGGDLPLDLDSINKTKPTANP